MHWFFFPYYSTMTHIPLLREGFVLMVGKGRWVVLPYFMDKDLPGLKTISMGVKEE